MNYNDLMLQGLRISNEDFETARRLNEGTDKNHWLGIDTYQMTCTRDCHVCVHRTNVICGT
jgi:hypothetical protein